jgi:hypothetical protein
MTNSIQVSLESECSKADQAAVADVFEAFGIPAQVEASYRQRSAAVLPWLIQIEAHLGQLISSHAGVRPDAVPGQALARVTGQQSRSVRPTARQVSLVSAVAWRRDVGSQSAYVGDLAPGSALGLPLPPYRFY